jgi:hypothetical protein
MQDFNKPRGTEEMLKEMDISPFVKDACIESNKQVLSIMNDINY